MLSPTAPPAPWPPLPSLAHLHTLAHMLFAPALKHCAPFLKFPINASGRQYLEQQHFYHFLAHF